MLFVVNCIKQRLEMEVFYVFIAHEFNLKKVFRTRVTEKKNILSIFVSYFLIMNV